MYHYLIPELHKLASVKLLTGQSQARLDALADWVAMEPVRWINEQSDGGWRYIGYSVNISPTENTIASLPSWDAQMNSWHTDAPTSLSGSWYVTGDAALRSYSGYVRNTGA
jgi:hypothetical protein